jgi:hypothetical protein
MYHEHLWRQLMLLYDLRVHAAHPIGSRLLSIFHGEFRIESQVHIGPGQVLHQVWYLGLDRA